MPKAKQAAETALRLDESLADAHAALGFIHLVYDWDGPAAEKELLRALDLNPTLASARLHYAAYLASQARHEESGPGGPASGRARSAVGTDPLVREHVPDLLATLRRSDRTRSKGPGTRTRITRSPWPFKVWPTPSRVDSRKPSPICKEPRSCATARRFRPCKRTSLRSPVGRKRRRSSFGRWKRRTSTDTSARTKSVTCYVSLGDTDTAYQWFRKGVEDRADCMAWLGVEPWIDPFRADPRYVRLMREIGLTPIAR